MFSALLYVRLERLSVTIFLAIESRRCEAAEIAGIASYVLASRDKAGYSSVCFHHLSGPPISAMALQFSAGS